MKRIVLFLVTAAISISVLNGCGPSEEEIRQREQARQDSLEQVRQAQLAQQRQAKLEQQRQDSIAAAKQREIERNRIEFDSNGAFAVQVGAWRSLDKAEAMVQKWVNQGFDKAFVVKFGKEETGNIWFRVRLGRFATIEMAEKFQAKLQREQNVDSWISMASDGEAQNV